MAAGGALVVYGPGGGKPPRPYPRTWTIYVCAGCGRDESDAWNPDCAECRRGQDKRWERVLVREQPPPIGPTVPTSSTSSETNQPKEAEMPRWTHGAMKLDDEELNQALTDADRAVANLDYLENAVGGSYQAMSVDERDTLRTAAEVMRAREARALRLTATHLVDQAEFNADRRADA